MKFCKDCRHFRKVTETCKHNKATYTNIVTGEVSHVFRACKDLRYKRDECGEGAKWFEPKLSLIDRIIKWK